MVSHTRRQALLAAGALGLAGCGASAERDDSQGPGVPGTSETGRRADAEVLNAALEPKLRALPRYEAFPELREEGEVERRHVERLERAVRELGAEPVTGVDDTDEGGLAPLRDRELFSIAALRDLIPKTSDRRLRSMLGQMLTDDGAQLAAIRVELGEPPAPDAFVTGEVPG